jgi:hypothetical protein
MAKRKKKSGFENITGEAPALTSTLGEAATYEVPSATDVHIKTMKLAEVKPYWRNPRDNEAGIEPVIASIKKFGYCQPIGIDTDNVIVVGHTRYRALMKMGVKEVSCIVLDKLTPQQVKQYRIADNKTAEFADWKLPELLSEIREFDSVADFQVFFPDGDLTEMLGGSLGGSVADVVTGDVVKAAEKNVSFTAMPDQLEVLCPNCAESFYINRKDVLERPI